MDSTDTLGNDRIVLEKGLYTMGNFPQDAIMPVTESSVSHRKLAPRKDVTKPTTILMTQFTFRVSAQTPQFQVVRSTLGVVSNSYTKSQPYLGPAIALPFASLSVP